MKQIRYIIVGAEVTPNTGKHHWQGYAEFFGKITLKKAQTAIGDTKAHCETRKGNREAARAYCMKEGAWYEMGNWNAGGQGARNDMIKLINNIKIKTDWDLMHDDPVIYNKYQRFIAKVREEIILEKSRQHLKSWAEKFVPNQFQEMVLTTVKDLTDRQILWICDPKGNSGKTWLSKYLISQGALRLCNAKTADIAYAYNGQHTIVLDFSRTIEGRVNYGAIEDLKNGMVFSGKYASCAKIFEPPKVICLANFMPEQKMLSEDRWFFIRTG